MNVKQLKPLVSPLQVSHRNEVLILKREIVRLNVLLGEADVKDKSQSVILTFKGINKLVDIQDIIFCQALGNYTKVFTRNDGSVLVSKSLKKMKMLISSSFFIRCHQSYLVNKNEILAFSYEKNMSLSMSNTAKVPVSRRQKKYVLAELGKA